MHNFQTPNPHHASEPALAPELDESRGDPFWFTLDEAVEAQRLSQRTFGLRGASGDGRMMRILTPIAGLIVGVPLLLSIVSSVLVLLPLAAVVYWAAISLKQEFFGFGGAAFNGDIKLSDGMVSLRFDENGMSTTHVVHPNPSMAWLLTDTVTVIKLVGNEVIFMAHPHLPEHTTHQLHQLLATRIGPPTPIRQETGSTLAEVGKLLGAMLLLMAVTFIGVSFR